MGEILNFDPYRKLQFDPSRPLEFDSGRNLSFDPGRQLGFLPNRDLGFGHRGVVFRGYVCPICSALVSEDAAQCSECETIFERKERAAAPPTPSAPPQPPKRAGEGGGRTPRNEPESAPPPRRAAPAMRSGAFCAYCGAKLHPGDAFCWNCGARSVGATEAVKLPSQKSEPVTREWK